MSRKKDEKIDFIIIASQGEDGNGFDEMVEMADGSAIKHGGNVNVLHDGNSDLADRLVKAANLAGVKVELPHAFWGEPLADKSRPWPKNRHGGIVAMRTAFGKAKPDKPDEAREAATSPSSKNRNVSPNRR